MRKVRTSLFVLVVAGVLAVLAAGCGSSSTTTSTRSPTTSTSGSSNAAVGQAVAKCKAVVNSRAPAKLKSKLIGICEKAGSSNAAGVKQILGQVCHQIIKSSVPAVAPKSLKDEALSECKKALG